MTLEGRHFREQLTIKIGRQRGISHESCRLAATDGSLKRYLQLYVSVLFLHYASNCSITKSDYTYITKDVNILS
jgi:hypothetical protein